MRALFFALALVFWTHDVSAATPDEKGVGPNRPMSQAKTDAEAAKKAVEANSRGPITSLFGLAPTPCAEKEKVFIKTIYPRNGLEAAWFYREFYNAYPECRPPRGPNAAAAKARGVK